MHFGHFRDNVVELKDTYWGFFQMEMGEKIYMLRRKLGLTLEEVGNSVGVGKSTVRKWEKGDIASIRSSKIIKLADVLQTTPAYLMGWADEKKPVTNLGDGLKGEAMRIFAELPAKRQRAAIEYLRLLSGSEEK